MNVPATINERLVIVGGTQLQRFRISSWWWCNWPSGGSKYNSWFIVIVILSGTWSSLGLICFDFSIFSSLSYLKLSILIPQSSQRQATNERVGYYLGNLLNLIRMFSKMQIILSNVWYICLHATNGTIKLLCQRPIVGKMSLIFSFFLVTYYCINTHPD